MDGLSYAGEPLDAYLRELDIVEEAVPAVDETSTATAKLSSSSASPALDGLPGAFKRAHRSPSPALTAAKTGRGVWWAELCLSLLPAELVTLLSLSADAREGPTPTGPTAASPVRADYRFLLVSSSLLEASLPRATERPPKSALVQEAASTDGADRTSSEAAGTRSPSLRDSAPLTDGASSRRQLQAASLIFFVVLAAVILILLLASPRLAWPAWLTVATTGLVLGGSFYLLPIVRRRQPVVGQPPEELPARRRKRLASIGSIVPPPPAEAVSAIERLVGEAEAFDRACNSSLARVWTAERERPAPDVTTLLPLRRRIADALSVLQHHVETAHANVLVLTSPSELYALSALYSLGTASTRPVPSFGPSSPRRLDSNLGQVTPLRRARTITAGSSSSTSARRTPLAVERFVSPPPRPTFSRASGSTPSDGELSPPPAPTQFTMMPPRTPRLVRHGRASSGAAAAAASEGPSMVLRSWSPLVPIPSPQPAEGDSRLRPRSSLLPSPSLSPEPATAGHKARNPSLDESEEDAAIVASASSSGLLPGMPRPSYLQRTPSGGSDRPQFIADSELQTLSQPTTTSRSAKRRSLQDITYRHASSPLAQLTSRRSPGEATFPPISPPGSTTGGLSRLRSMRSGRSSFSYAAGSRPVFGAFSPIPGQQRPRHRPTLSLTSPSVPNLQARAFEQQQAALSDLSASLTAAEPLAGLCDAESDSPVPLSHADLLTTFWALHTRRRHLLVALLALRRDMVVVAWEEAATFVGNLATAFEDAKDEVARALLIAGQFYGGGGGADGDDSFAPPPLTKAQQRQASLGQLWEGLQLLTGKFGSLEDSVESGDGWEPTWLELRDDLGELIRVWERARVGMGIHVEGSLVGQTREIPTRPLDVSSPNEGTDEAQADAPKDSSAPAQVEIEDDVSRYLRETANALPSVGREKLFAAESAPGPSRRPPSKMTREERIRLAREHREETQRAVAEAAAKKGPRGMSDVILELDGLMRVLRRSKGAVEPEEEQEMLLDAEDGTEDAPFGRHLPTATQGAVPLAATAYRHLPPFELPLPLARDRSSLPALSSQGSSDGEGDLDDSLEFVSPRHRDGSQVTLRAAESDEEDGLVPLGREVCEPTKL